MRQITNFVCVLSVVSLALCGTCFTTAKASATLNELRQTASSGCSLADATDIRQLEREAMIERELTGGQTHLYQISVPAKQFISVIVDQRGIDVALTLCAPDGVRVAKVDRPNGSFGPEAISIITEQSGTFTLVLKSLERSALMGRYQIHIAQQRDPETGDDIRIKAEKTISEAEVQRGRGKLETLRTAVDGFELARELWHSLNEPYEEALALYGLGWSYTEIGSHGMVKFPLPVHRLRWGYQSRSTHEKAIASFNRSVELMKQVGDRYGEAIAQADRGWPELYLDQNKAALESFENAHPFFKETGNARGEAKVLYGMGWVNVIQGNHSEALNHFSKSLPLRQVSKDRKGEAITLAAISRSQNQLGRNIEALDSAEQALTLFKEINDSHGQASTSSILGWINYSLGRFEQALKFFDESLVLRRAANDDTGEALARYGIARVNYLQGDLQQALQGMSDVLAIIEPLRDKGENADLRTYYFANVHDYYEFYIDLLMQLERIDQNGNYAKTALAAHERGRARELLAILAEAGDVSPRTGAVLSQPLIAADIQRLLDSETLLLEFAMGEQRSYLWAVSNTRVESFELPKRAEIEKKALSLYKLLISRNELRKGETESQRRHRTEREDRQYEVEARALSATLLGQVASKLGTKRLVIVADGALQFIPFGALSAPVSPDSKMSRPLVIDHEIVSLPSASVLSALRKELEERAPAPKKLAVLADPVFTVDDPRVSKPSQKPPLDAAHPGSPHVLPAQTVERSEVTSKQGLRRLFGTRWEAQQITSLLPEDERLIALDFDASRSRVLSGELSSYQVIHFATHALISDADPSTSTVALSQVDEKGAVQNGSLTLHDIYGLKLRARLAVLSACRTGLGKDVRGEGIRGLAGGFMQAGVPSVIVSLWPVNDRVTAEFMFRFYRLMLGKQEMSAAQALREVQKDMLKDGRWDAAYFWAPFVLQGEWK